MSASPIITGLTVFFSVTTLVVIAYPIIKLLPSRLERRVYARIAEHRDAAAALELAIDRLPSDTMEGIAQRARLSTQLDYQRRCLMKLAPETAATMSAKPGSSVAA